MTDSAVSFEAIPRIHRASSFFSKLISIRKLWTTRRKRCRPEMLLGEDPYTYKPATNHQKQNSDRPSGRKYREKNIPGKPCMDSEAGFASLSSKHEKSKLSRRKQHFSGDGVVPGVAIHLTHTHRYSHQSRQPSHNPWYPCTKKCRRGTEQSWQSL